MTDEQMRPREPRSLIVFGYAKTDDADWSRLAVTSREMLAVEQSTKGFTANTFFANVSVTGLYRLAFVVLKLRGELDKATKFEEFTAGYDIKFGDPAEPDGEPAGDDGDDDGSEVDPTRPAA